MPQYPSTQSSVILGPVAVVVYRSKSNQLPVDQVPENGPAFFRTHVFTPDNNPLNIVDMRIVYVVRASLFSADYAEVDCSVVRPDYGEIEVFIPDGIMQAPGLHLAAIQVYNLDGKLLYQSPRYLEISPRITSVKRPVTVAEVRFNLRDYPELNSLLSDVEFSDNEIAYCISKPVEIWNEMTPDVGQYDLEAAAHLRHDRPPADPGRPQLRAQPAGLQLGRPLGRRQEQGACLHPDGGAGPGQLRTLLHGAQVRGEHHGRLRLAAGTV
jgi:hypothetical protein